MRKSRQISLKECYDILQISRDATLDDIKKAYRRRAFELHPDLNPDTPNAGYQFQDLNEAYVALTRMLEAEEARQASAAAAQEKRQQEKADREAERKAAQEEKARARQEKVKEREEKAKAQAQAKAKEREEQAKAREREAQAKAKERAEAQARGEAEDRQREREEAAERAYAERQRAQQAYAQEDVLRDLLHDPFARRVFEDIYSEVNKQGARKGAAESEQKTQNAQDLSGQEASKAKPEPERIRPAEHVSATVASPAPPTARVNLKDDKPNLHFANFFSDKIKGWFRQQIDDEQTIKMPASSLFVGARIRLQIRRGLAEDLSTVEITLPPEFVVGKALRLRGLGKKVGKWQGDLYLTIESK